MGGAIAVQSQQTSAYTVEAAKHLAQGQLQRALSAAQRARDANPDDAQALNLLGVIEGKQGQIGLAVTYLRRAVQLEPSSPEFHFNLGMALQQAQNVVEAEAHYLEAIRLKPTAASFHNNLGALYQACGELAQAQLSFKRAVNCDPAYETAISNLAGVSRVLGDSDTLERVSAVAVQRWPTNPTYWLMRAEALFTLGRFTEAWNCHERRFKAKDRPVISRALRHIPNWAGEDLSGRSLLVWTEQGPGDEVMFASLIGDLERQVRSLSILCSPRMQPVLARSFPRHKVYAEGIKKPDEAVDFQSSIVSAAKLVRKTWSDFNAASPYLKADQEKTAALRGKYKAGSADILVGIAWRSLIVNQAAEKSVNLGAWGALFSLPGIRFVNLQYGDCAKDIANIKTAYGVDVINDAGIDSLKNLDDYAAQVAAMDLVVSSSNTAAHFAGALGVPTHCMVPATLGKGRRWYWLAQGGACVWYPSLRLYEQKTDNQWVDVIRDITLAVARRLTQGARADEVVGALLRLAQAYKDAADKNGAVAVWSVISELPGYEAIGLGELGREAKDEGQLDRAEHFFDLALAAKPDSGPLLNMKGLVLAAREKFAEAETYYRRAIASMPDTHEPYNNLGTAVRRLGRGVEAHALYQRASDLKPGHKGILQNLATNLTELGRPGEALPYFDELLSLYPDYAEGHQSRAFALLSLGRYQEGWPGLWWRHQVKENEDRPAESALPRWAGQRLDGKKVLIWTEHGVGDEILTVSILAGVIEHFAAVTLACSTRLIPVFQRSFPTARVINIAHVKSLDLSAFDYQLTFGELGAAFRTSLAQFDAQVPFLKPDLARKEGLSRKYRTGAPTLVVGLSWASAHRELATLKGLTLEQLVAALPPEKGNLTCVSLQYGTHTPEIEAVKSQTGWSVIEDPDVDAIADMDAFTAQVAAMDVVVTISNTTAHVAGALGVPTFLLLPYGRGRHWYWLRNYPHCPWYPSVRYFEQSEDGSWDTAVAACRDALQNFRPKAVD